MDRVLYSHFLKTHPKSRLFQIVKVVPTNGIPKIKRTPITGIPEIRTIHTSISISGIPIIWYIRSFFQFVELQKWH